MQQEYQNKINQLPKGTIEEMSISDKEALNLLYSSILYEKLEKEETKVWHLSVPTLYSLFIEEQETGKIIFPEEA